MDVATAIAHTLPLEHVGSGIVNDSSVTGDTVTDALNTLWAFFPVTVTLQQAYDAAPTANPQILTDGVSSFVITMPDPASATPADFRIDITSNTQGSGGSIYLSAGGTFIGSEIGGSVQCLGGDANAKNSTSGFFYATSGAANEVDGGISNYVRVQSGGASLQSGDWYQTTGDVLERSALSGTHYRYTGDALGSASVSGNIEDETGDADGVTGSILRETGEAFGGLSGGFTEVTGPGFSTGGFSRTTGAASDDTSGGFLDHIGDAASDPGSFQYIGGNTYASSFIIQNCTSLQVLTSTYNISMGNQCFSGHTGGFAFSNSSNVNMGLSQESGVALNFSANTTHNGTVVGTRQGGTLQMNVTTTLPVIALLWRDNRALLGAASEKVTLQTSSTTGDIGLGSGHTVGTNTYNAGVDIFPRSAAGLIPSLMVRSGASTPGDILRLAASNGTSILASFSSVAAFSPRQGQTTAGTAPIYFTSGTNLTSAVAGAMEFSSSELFFTPSTTRFQVAYIDRAQTHSLAQTFTSDVTISKATPALILTDSGGDDYKIDVAAGNFGITNTTDGVRGFQISATNEILVTNLTFGSPGTAQLFEIADRVSNAASASRAAFAANASVVTGSAWSGGNIRGFLGGAVYVADQDFNNGAVLIGLEGGTVVISNTHIIQSVIGLFGTLQLSGSSTTSLGTNFGSFNTVGAGHTLTTLRHFAYANASFSGTVTTQYGFFCPALTGAGTNFEVFMDTTARTYYRASTQYVYSSAASTLDLSSNTTLNLRIGGTVKTALTATELSQTGDFKLTTAGNGLYIKEGTNATSGVATLVAGTVVVNTTKVAANSRIQLTAQTLGTILVPAAIGVTARTAGTSFTITSAGATDTSVVGWVIVEPA